MSTSILDRVLQSQDQIDRHTSNPLEVVSQLLKLLSTRESDILRMRFGIDGNKHKTLELIGQQYRITRERVRQIERQSVERLKEMKEFETIAGALTNVIIHQLKIHGYIRRKDRLLNELLASTGDTPSNRNSLSFLVEHLLSNHIESVEDETIHPAWKVRGAALDLFHELVAYLTAFFEQRSTPLATQELILHIRQSDYYQNRNADLQNLILFASHGESIEEMIERILHSYLELSTHLQQNPFGEWGLVSWQSVRPKRMGDKIYLVLKKHGEPLHFTDIATHINQTKFDHKKAHPPTVHNELILDKRFVLVGRGIYALKEWGYEPGVVADVITSILERARTPLTREEIIDAVAEQRMVKKGTILLALTNKNRFTRTPDNRYTIPTSLPSGSGNFSSTTPSTPSSSME